MNCWFYTNTGTSVLHSLSLSLSLSLSFVLAANIHIKPGMVEQQNNLQTWPMRVLDAAQVQASTSPSELCRPLSLLFGAAPFQQPRLLYRNAIPLKSQKVEKPRSSTTSVLHSFSCFRSSHWDCHGPSGLSFFPAVASQSCPQQVQTCYLNWSRNAQRPEAQF